MSPNEIDSQGDTNGNMWQHFKDIAEWFWVMFLGIVGNVSNHWDSYVAKVTAFFALAILAHKFKKTFFPNKKQQSKQEQPDEGD